MRTVHSSVAKLREDNERSELKFVYTPMHGVGAPYAHRAFEIFRLKPFIEVAEQVRIFFFLVALSDQLKNVSL